MRAVLEYLVKLTVTVVAVFSLMVIAAGFSIAIYENWMSYDARLANCERALKARGLSTAAVERYCLKETRP